jgi:glyoxylase-like metal-dependent hydrolase (beta-lactamase superfamily II)
MIDTGRPIVPRNIISNMPGIRFVGAVCRSSGRTLRRIAWGGAALLVSQSLSLPLLAADDGIAIDRAQYANRPLRRSPFPQSCPETERFLVQISGNLYRHANQAWPAVHSGLVLITSEGAIVIDPALKCTSTWLKDEIKARFNQPVKYVIYTHAHFDHIEGGDVFQDAGALVVAHRNAVEVIVGERLPTAVPDKVYDKQMTIELGGETVHLFRIAPSHSNSMSMVLFPRYRALQCTDVCQSKTFPFMDFLDFYYDGWIETLDWVLQQDVDVIDVGHYKPGTKEDQRALRDYMIDLHDQVLALVREGRTWDELWRNVKFKDSYKEWFGWEHMRFPNILGMHRWVVPRRRGAW